MSESFSQRMEKARLALVAHIDAVRDANIGAIAAQANQESSRITAAAHARARMQVHNAVREERRQRQHQRRMAAGEAEHALRKLQHRLILTALDEALARLKDKLPQLWSDAEVQIGWLNMTLAVAEQRLTGNSWRLDHPQGWDKRRAAAAINAFTAQHQSVILELHPSDEIRCGYRIRCGDITIDSSLAGILDDRDEIQGRLLGVLEMTPGWPGGDHPQERGVGQHGG